MEKKDIVGITVNGVNVANFSIPEIGYNVKVDEYQITHVGGIHEFSVALVRDSSNKELSIADKVAALEIMKQEFADFSKPDPAPVSQGEPVPSTLSDLEIVPVAEPVKKPRKPREPKNKSPEVQPTTDPVETPRAEETVAPKTVAPQTISGDVNTARLPYLKKMIGFYARAKEMKKEDVTINVLKSDALDIVEKDDDATILAAIDAYKKE